jgi:hypothetical protein
MREVEIKKELVGKKWTKEEAKKKGFTQLEVLCANGNDVIEMMSEGKSYVDIAEKYGVHVMYIVDFTNNTEYRTRAKSAQQSASYYLLQEAENHLHDMSDDATSAKVRRCSELSQFKAYLAKTKNRAELDLNYKEKDDNSAQQLPPITINLKTE